MDSKQWDSVAAVYHDEVISPFQKGVKNPVFDALRNIPARKRKVVGDFGTGNGPLLGFLAREFREVHALDFSPVMLAHARERHRKRTNIRYACVDMLRLDRLPRRLDVAVSVNSILFPSAADCEKALHNIRASLCGEGIFIGIFPSMESLLYHAMLVYRSNLQRFSQEKARAKTAAVFEEKKYDFIRGVYAHSAREMQKAFYQFELEYLLGKSGFRNVSFQKVVYPWLDGISDHERFPGEKGMWDWLVVAQCAKGSSAGIYLHKMPRTKKA